jgi:hypothetical protein
MSEIHSGSCLCGQIQYDIVGDFESFFLCHCKYCQKDTGSAHAANLFSSTATLKWLAGHDKVVVFNLPSTRHARSFCSLCGSAVPSQQFKGSLLVVPAGSLDSEVNIEPNAHLFVSSRANWDHELEHVPCYEGLPT